MPFYYQEFFYFVAFTK